MNAGRTLALALALAATLAACSSEDQKVETTETQEPSRPTGTVVGVVTSLRTGAPLQGVTVAVQTQSGAIVSATTDANGAYVLGGLAAGATYAVRFSSAGYVPRLQAASISDSAGEFPADGLVQLNVALAQANATVSGRVLARDGAPAAGVVLTIDLRGAGYDLVATATTDAQGAYTFTGLPGAPSGLTMQLVTQPWDADADGLADYDALSSSVVTYPGASSLRDVDLRLAAEELLLLTSNVESGTVAADAALQLTFNRELDLSATSAVLVDSTAGRTVAVVLSVDASGKVLTVDPAGGTALAAYHAYTLSIAAEATNGDRLNVSRSFTADVPVALLPAVTGLTVTPAAADFDTATFTLSWNASDAAAGYEIWVRDTRDNPSYLLMRTVGASPTPSATVTLPSQFDWYGADGVQTPLARGVAVDFAVVAVNAAGDAAAPSTVTPVRRADTVAPPVESVVQRGTADNTAGSSARTLTLALTFGEYMDIAVAPTISLPNTSMAATFSWNANRTAGTFTITVPATTDGRGSYTVSGAKDTSGNTMASRAGSLVGQVELLSNGGFETAALSGWTTTYSGTSTAPVASTAVVASGTGSVQIGNATAGVQSGTSQIYQALTLPTGYASIVASVAYRPYTNYAYAGHDSSSCAITNSTGTVVYATIFSTYQDSTTFSTASLDISGYAGYAVRIRCQTVQDGVHITGVYVDDVSIVASP